MKKLPYRARTTSGDVFDIEFPLHNETGDAVRVGQLVSKVLDALDKDIALAGETSNGDVLQAMAMVLAIRARMIHAPRTLTESLSIDLVRTALDAVASSVHQDPKIGHA